MTASQGIVIGILLFVGYGSAFILSVLLFFARQKSYDGKPASKYRNSVIKYIPNQLRLWISGHKPSHNSINSYADNDTHHKSRDKHDRV